MKKIEFNENWICKRADGTNQMKVTLPHDAMITEKRSEKSLGLHNIGWFEAYDYVYTKTFFVPEDYKEKNVVFEFEGVYRNAEVYINGKKAMYRPYGYTNFYVPAMEYLQYGANNEITVTAQNADQPNSRWYSGSGIYRPVHMFVADKKHILLNGVKIRTISINPAKIEVDVKTSAAGNVKVAILDGDKEVTSVHTETTGETTVTIEVPKAKLWSCDSPNLYQCKVTFEEDEVEETFGIRTLTWDANHGMCINGERVILRGACIHHDNGVLGACAYPEAEERKIRIMKENGYNAVRSAHNPCSKAILDACDRLGMLMMDEYLDVWYIHKTEFDYASYMVDWWLEDLKDMVEKDYNHPSVIMYSTGNEVAETAQKRGIELTGQMTQYLHGLDPTRPVTCGINIFFNFLSSIGFGVYSDDKAKKEAKKAVKDQDNLNQGKKKKKPVGSEFYNTLAGILGDKTMKIGATLYPCDVKTRDAFANMDIAGYNYGILRYKGDLKKYPNRLILGSETFCKDSYTFWEFAKDHPRIIGDFVWAGMDYMGEAGIGSWEYEDYAPADGSVAGWIAAGSGRINLIGRPNGESAYTKVAFEQTDKPAIAVKPVYQKGKHSPSAWKMTDAMESWSWRGCAGDKAVVEVYARAKEVELLINGRSVGRQKMKKACNTTFNTIYEDGEVTAVAYDEFGKETGRTTLKTAGTETKITLTPEQEAVKKDGLAFVLIQYTDEQGILKPMEKHEVKVSVEGGILKGLGSACPYTLDSYCNDVTKTYYGEALAVIQADGTGPVRITVEDEKQVTTTVIPYKE
jgi:beta-galactosidase